MLKRTYAIAKGKTHKISSKNISNFKSDCKKYLLTIIYFIIVSCINILPLLMAFFIVGFNDTGETILGIERVKTVITLTFISCIAITPIYAVGSLLFINKKVKKWLDLKTFFILLGLLVICLISWYWYVIGEHY